MEKKFTMNTKRKLFRGIWEEICIKQVDNDNENEVEVRQYCNKI